MRCYISFLAIRNVFGERISFESSIGKSNYDIRSLTYCDLHKIARKDLLEVFHNYPEFEEKFWENLEMAFDLTVRN